jgi:transcriptional regulator with XRE-family HTH domain
VDSLTASVAPCRSVNRHPSLINFGKKLRKRREELGISQEELADRAGLDRTYVGGVERGERNLGLLNLLKIAIALNTTASALLQGVVIKKDR